MARTTMGRRLGRILRIAQSARSARLGVIGRHGLSRRRFLGGAAAISLAGPALANFPATAQPIRSAGVIGGGLSGLSAALRLAEAGVAVTVYEGRSRLGGRVFSAPAPFAADLVLDLGGSFVNTDHDDMIDLCNRVDLPLFRRATAADGGAPPVAYFANGSSLSEADLAEALGPVADRIAADADALDDDFDAVASQLDQLSVADYLDRIMPEKSPVWARHFLEATIRTEYGVEPAAASALELIWLGASVKGQAVDLMSASDEAFEIAGGSGLLPLRIGALVTELGGSIRLGAPVVEIVDRGTGVEIGLRDGQTASVDVAVISLPFTVLREVAVRGPVPDGFRRFIDVGRLGRNEKLMIGFDGRPWRAAGAFAFEGWTDGPAPVIWDATLRQLDNPRAGLTVYFSADGVDALARHRSAKAAADWASDAFSSLIPGLADARRPGPLRTGWSRDPFSRGAYSSFAPGVYTAVADYLWQEGEAEDDHSGPVFGRLAFVGEHLSDEYYGFMNGAAQTGRLAAEALLAAG